MESQNSSSDSYTNSQNAPKIIPVGECLETLIHINICGCRYYEDTCVGILEFFLLRFNLRQYKFFFRGSIPLDPPKELVFDIAL